MAQRLLESVCLARNVRVLMWLALAAVDGFRVRGKTYLDDGVKVPASNVPVFEAVAFDVVSEEPAPLTDVPAIGHTLRVMVATKAGRHAVARFYTPVDNAAQLGPCGALFSADELTHASALHRLKCIAHDNSASWFSSLCPQVPLRVSAVFATTREQLARNVVDVRVDLLAPHSLLHWPLVTAALTAASQTRINIGFVMEGETRAELPEAVFAAVQLCYAAL